MKLSFAAFVVFSAATSRAFTVPNHGRRSISSSQLSSTVEVKREAPSAGWVPDWEDRPGLTPEEFMESDMSKPDLSGMWECPLTRWNSEGYVSTCGSILGFHSIMEILTVELTSPRFSPLFFSSIDIVKAQKEAAKVPHCPLEVRATTADNAMGAEYFAKNRDKIRQDLLKHGAIWFRGFDLMKAVKGHREMYEALGLAPCLDPLHSSGLRKFASERDALYEEVRATR